ncbi:MAG: MXAN_6521/LA_1396 family lipoprotein [Archangiaceae bacterium]|nr:MXAN_6521/LA_1396 family lipoprotein [Archangiaceae bacterium]
MRALTLALSLVVASSCSVVKMSRVADDWETGEKNKLKRVVVLVQPLPDGNEKVGAMFARVARRYVHMKRNFLVKADVARAAAQDRGTDCVEGFDGILWLEPQVKTVGEGVEANVKGTLLRCSDGREVWAAEAGGSFHAYDEGLKEVAANYGRENGAEVERYVPAAMNVLRPLLDTLPQPELNDADVEEKMTLDE